MQLTTTTMPELRNIHVAKQSTGAGSSDCERAGTGNFRKVKRSPDEEFAARLALAGGVVDRLPQSVLALILQEQKRVEVGPNGIRIEYRKNVYKFWHPHSKTCANQRGEKVLVTFDPDDMSFVHVLTEDGRYVESVPLKGKVQWFDEEAMRDALTRKAHALNRDLEYFRDVHQATSQEKAQRIRTNAEKMQMVVTIGGARTGAAGAETGAGVRSAAGFEKADEILKAREAIIGQRAEHVARRERRADRIRRETGDVRELLPEARRGFGRNRMADADVEEGERADLEALQELT